MFATSGMLGGETHNLPHDPLSKMDPWVRLRHTSFRHLLTPPPKSKTLEEGRLWSYSDHFI